MLLRAKHTELHEKLAKRATALSLTKTLLDIVQVLSMQPFAAIPRSGRAAFRFGFSLRCDFSTIAGPIESLHPPHLHGIPCGYTS